MVVKFKKFYELKYNICKCTNIHHFAKLMAILRKNLTKIDETASKF
jgi:hypothetical protein